MLHPSLLSCVRDARRLSSRYGAPGEESVAKSTTRREAKIEDGARNRNEHLGRFAAPFDGAANTNMLFIIELCEVHEVPARPAPAKPVHGTVACHFVVLTAVASPLPQLVATAVHLRERQGLTNPTLTSSNVN